MIKGEYVLYPGPAEYSVLEALRQYTAKAGKPARIIVHPRHVQSAQVLQVLAERGIELVYDHSAGQYTWVGPVTTKPVGQRNVTFDKK